jgi:hypothetical protein
MSRKFCRNKTIYLVLILLFSREAIAQNDFFRPAAAYNPERARQTLIAEAVVTAAVFTELHFLWYRKFPHSGFHFFNDNGEWLQMDKIGHAFSAYQIAALQSDLMRWNGMAPDKAALTGTATALGLMSIIEVLDGFSSQWGFSDGDMAANISGCLLFQGQQWTWNEQRMSLKFSYHYSPFAQYRPNVLGSNWAERILKDYNGQTYWLSANIGSFLPGNSKFPSWLNAAVGYGADGMLGGMDNPKEVNGQSLPEFKRYRQFYFSFDTDLYRIDNLSPLGVSVLKMNRALKMPAPALEWNVGQSLKVKGIYY